MEHFDSTICRNTIVDILRYHMFIHQMVNASVSSNLLVLRKCSNNRSTKLHTGLDQRLQRKDRTSVRPLHISRTPPIDLTIPDRWLERVIRPSRRVRGDNVHMPVEKNLRTVTLSLESRVGI